MYSKLVATAVLLAIAVFSVTRYRTMNESYDRSRPAAESDRSFGRLYRVLMLIAAAAAVLGLWFDEAALLEVHQSDVLRALGSAISVLGAIGFEASARALGNQYSPCFDLRVPTRRADAGPYRCLSHPMYLSNLAILFGAFIASGSMWVLLIAGVVGIYYLRSARRERELLAMLDR